jgi:hypothetical protein
MTLVNVPGYRNYPFAGWLVQRDLSKKVTLGTEIFYHEPEGLATPQTRPATLVDIGGYYEFRDPFFGCYSAMATPPLGKRRTTPTLGSIGPGARRNRMATSPVIRRGPRSTALVIPACWEVYKRSEFPRNETCKSPISAKIGCHSATRLLAPCCFPTVGFPPSHPESSDPLRTYERRNGIRPATDLHLARSGFGIRNPADVILGLLSQFSNIRTSAEFAADSS